jgi:Ca-activated chloride channel family protein
MNRCRYALAAFLLCLLAACAQPRRETPTEPADTRDATTAGHEVLHEPLPAAPPAPSYAPAEAHGQMSMGRVATRMPPDVIAPPEAPVNRENYAPIDDNPVQRTREQPVSTFSIDVDTGSYANVRRMLADGYLPPADAVRAEELINYFDYGYPAPSSREVPFAATTEIAPAPWNTRRHLLLVGIKGYEVPKADIPAANLVYLVDTSGSMQTPDKIDLLKQGFTAMTRQLRPQDRVSIVAYAGSAGLVLPPTSGRDQSAILAAIDRLQAGGSTNGGAGIELAYAVARQHFIPEGVNRVILASDGDFNVGLVSFEALTSMIAEKRKSGIGLTVLGFGGGNYNDHLAEQLANEGNGNYFYIDTAEEVRKVLVDQLASTVLTIAQDVKIQVEFNPAVVEEYRLIGYENRLLAREDFNNDRVDGGEIGAGHNVTALYEIALVGSGGAASDPLRYADAETPSPRGDELAFLRLRYKQPGASRSQLVEQPLSRSAILTAPGARLRLAAAVAAFADALRGGTHIGDWQYGDIRELAASAGADAEGYRAGFLAMIDRAQALSTSSPDGHGD